MLQKALLTCFILCFVNVESKIVDFKVITAVRHGLEIALDYIEKNVYRINVDCALGVAFVRGFMKTALKNGSHIMDRSSLKILNKSEKIIEKCQQKFENDRENGNDWKFKNLVKNDIWTKPIQYKSHHLLADRIKNAINDIFAFGPLYDGFNDVSTALNSDICLREIINSTSLYQQSHVPCMITVDCWNNFLRNGNGHGYYLTHKLLLLQIAKGRKCLMDKDFYNLQIRDVCSSIMFEIIYSNNYGIIEKQFDLFLEQVLLCGYEGFTEFVQNDWLFHIIKSQHPSGCFSDNLSDRLKSRLKRDVTYFEDNCNDHSTGLGVAVLGLYYNYIINMELNL